jgi:hypothetical protein
MSKMVGSEIFQILQGSDTAEHHAHFNVMFGRMVASTKLKHLATLFISLFQLPA